VGAGILAGTRFNCAKQVGDRAFVRLDAGLCQVSQLVTQGGGSAMRFELQGSRALVTGASRGIGPFLAETLARRGVSLVLSARALDSLDDTRRACAAHGVNVDVVAADLCDKADRARLLDAAGPIDLLINNAGLEVPIAFLDQSADEVAAQLTTNLEAPLSLMHRVLPGMVARGRGVVVNISSMSGKTPTPFNAVYTSTKYALNGLSAAVDMELTGTGVHVGVVCPSFVSAGMWADSGAKAPALLREVPAQRVAEAMLRVIDGATEVLVTPGPMRPLLALAALAPGLTPPLLKAMGVRRTLEERAARHLEARTEPQKR
ncbi:MAG: SDR family NAD(P)-dependent oxidoreductase, partial [Myxococcota bacterium]